MAFRTKQGRRRIVYDETPQDILPQLYTPAEDMDDYRYRGYLYNLREPRYPVTGPIGFRDVKKSYPLKSHLIKGKPVLPPIPGTGFVHGSSEIENFTEKERKDRKYNLRLLEKSSAELRKLQRQQRDRQQFMEDHQKQKEAEENQKVKEKLEDLKLLTSYNPFGKPGFGAPRGAEKQSLIMTKALLSKDGVGLVKEEVKAQTPKFELPPNRPPIQRYEDDRMRRYRVDKKTAEKYKKELDALIDAKKHRIRIVENIDKQREDAMIGYDPFGKPGAGAPNIDENGNILMHRKQRVAIPEIEPTLDSPDESNPWMKLGQAPPRKKHFPRAGDHGIYEFVDAEAEKETHKKLGGGGEPLLDDNGSVITKRAGLLTTIHGARRTENITKVATPEEIRGNVGVGPWGKPGAGAPLTNSRGEIVKNTKGRIKYESMGYSQKEEENMERAKKIYRDDLQKGIEVQKTIREEEKSYMRLPPGDVPSWFSKGKVGRPKRDPVTGIIVPQKRIMSDVTAQKFNIDRPRDVEKYYRDLQQMADERSKKRKAEKERLLKQDIKSGTTTPPLVRRATLASVFNLAQDDTSDATSRSETQPQEGRCSFHPEEAVDKKLTLRVKYPFRHTVSSVDCAKPAGSFSSALGNRRRYSSPLRSPVRSEKEVRKLKRVFGLEKFLRQTQPFPHSVVAPWAVDA